MATARKTHRGSAVGGLLHSPSVPALLILAAVVIGLAALLPLVQSSDATSINGNIQKLEQEKADWQARLHEMELEVAGLGSLDRVEREATQRLHMTAPQSVQYITVDVPAPAGHKLPSRFLPPQPEPRQSGSSIWHKLFGWFPLP